MKTYKKIENVKSWRIALIDETETSSAKLCAVDAITGKELADLFVFLKDGDILLPADIPKILKKEGYNPFEYHNQFDIIGRLIMIDAKYNI